MNVDEILNNPNLNGKKDRIVKTSINTITDSDGMVLSNDTVKDIIVDREPAYVKIYIDSLCVFNGISIALSPILLAFSRHMTYANNDTPRFRHIVRTDAMTRQDVSEKCNISDSRVKQAIKELIETEVFIPIKKTDGKIRKGVYYVNPWLIARGDWTDIKKLRAEFEFVNGEFAVCAENEDGSRKVVVPSTKRRENNCDKIIELDLVDKENPKEQNINDKEKLKEQLIKDMRVNLKLFEEYAKEKSN